MDKENEVIMAAGGIVWRETETRRKLALVHRPKYDDWSLPKGKLKKGESWQATALREVKEETGCEAMLNSLAGSTAYTVKGVPKVVLFWNMTLTKIEEHLPDGEVDEVIWLTKEDALEKLDYQAEKTLLMD